MNYNNMMKNWKNFLIESDIPQKSLLNETTPELADRLKAFGNRPIEEYPFRNLFGDKRRQIIFMEVKPDGTIFDIIEFFQSNGWVIDFGKGIVTKAVNTPKGEKSVTIKIMKALLKVKGVIEAVYVKPDKFYDENNSVWTPYIIPYTKRLKDDAPKKARNLHAEYRRLFENGQSSMDRFKYGQNALFYQTGFEENLDYATNTAGTATFKGRGLDGKETEFEIVATNPIQGATDKLHEMYPNADVQGLNRIDPVTGDWVKALRVWITGGAEFPRISDFSLDRPTEAVDKGDGNFEHLNKIDSWIKYLNTPVPDVKKSGPALDYYQRNPEILEMKELKPVVISRDTTDIGRMSDFPESGIDSCHTEGHSHDYCAIREADEGGLLAYMFEPEDMNEFLFPEDPDMPLAERGLDEIQEALDDWDEEEIMGDPRRDVDGMIPAARVRLRRYINTEENYELALPDPTVYGDRYPGFNKAVTDWALENQEGYLPENYAAWKRDDDEADDFFNSFVYTGGSYHRDAESGEMFNNFFGSDVYKNTDMVEYDPLGKYEEEPQYQSGVSASAMEAEAQEVEDDADLDHGGIWFQVDEHEFPPALDFSGDFRWDFPADENDKEVRSDKAIPGWSSEGEYRELINEIESILYKENFYYSDVQIDEAGDTIYITAQMEIEEERNTQGFKNLADWMVELDGTPWDKARKKLKAALRRQGYLEMGEALDGTALEGLKHLKNFVEFKPGRHQEPKSKDFSFQLKHLMPIGSGYNMPEVLASTYWSMKQPGDIGLSGVYNQRAYDDLQNGYDLTDRPWVRWYAMGKDLFQFVVREVLRTEPEEQLELPFPVPGEQLELPLKEESISARTAQERAAEEETFAGATVQGLEGYLKNFIVKVQAVQQAPVLGADRTKESKTFKGWEEFGRRKEETGELERGLQTSVPIEMHIEFDIDEEDTPQEVGLGIQILLWMDNNIEEVQQQAGALLQKYNDVYLKGVDRRIIRQENLSNEVEMLAAELSKAAEDMLKQFKSRSVGVWDDEGVKRIIINSAESLLKLKERLMGDLMEWSPDEPMAGSLLHRYERAKSAVDKLEHTARVRNLIVNQLKTLSSSNPAYYRKVVDLYHHRAVSLKNMSDEEAKEIVIMGLTRLYNEYINRGTQASVDYPQLRKWMDAVDQINWHEDPHPAKAEGEKEELEDIFSEARIRKAVQIALKKVMRQ